MKQSFKRYVLAGVLLTAVLSAVGCQIFAIPFAERDPKRKVAAEYHLTAERLLIFPYVSYDISYDYPAMSLDLMQQVMLRLSKDDIKGVIDPREVMAFQQNNLDWQSMPVERLGRLFNADKVLYLEVSSFTLMELQSANLYRGRGEVTIQVVEVPPSGEATVPYEGSVSLVLPPDRPIGTSEISAVGMYQATLIKLAERVALKFYAYEERVFTGGGR